MELDIKNLFDALKEIAQERANDIDIMADDEQITVLISLKPQTDEPQTEGGE